MSKKNLNISEIGSEIVNIARKYGCSAQVTILERESKDINVRQGEIEQLLSTTAVSTGIRLFSGKRSTIIAFSGSNFDDMDARIKKALNDMAYLEDDEAKRLLEKKEFDAEEIDIELSDDGFGQIDTAPVAETLKKIEKKGLAFSSKIIPSEMAEFSASGSRISLFSSKGLHKTYKRSSYAFAYTAVAEDKEKGIKEVDSYFESKRFFADLPELEQIGEIAAERALKKLGGRKIKSGEMKVIFSYRTAPTILDLLSDALGGEDIVLRNSFLVGKLGEKIFPDHVTIEDNPLIDRYPGSYPFDGEGKNGRQKFVFEKGRLLTYLHNSYSAAKLKMALTGNASLSLSSSPGIESGNFFLRPGTGSLDDLVKEMKNGFVVEELFSSGMNPVTGDFSFGCTGFLVESGRITTPVKEITIAGNLLDLFKNIAVIADDNRWKSSISSPSFLVSKLTIAGT
ncbi:MAG: TldD/PmbA family protein [Candidatus Aminicenantes bacterium]|nr:TldD/PmbA family protein [Candidatus Aminicenantes bacterium]